MLPVFVPAAWGGSRFAVDGDLGEKSCDHLARDVALAEAFIDGTVARAALGVPRVDRYAHGVTSLGLADYAGMRLLYRAR